MSTPFWELQKWFSPTVLLHEQSYRQLAYFLGLRVLTPIGAVLFLVGAVVRTKGLTERPGSSRSLPSGQPNSSLPVPLGEGCGTGKTPKKQSVHHHPDSLLRKEGLPDACAQKERSALFHVWLVSLIAYFPILVRELDHEHYYLALAPVAAVFIARALVCLYSAQLSDRLHLTGRMAAVSLAGLLLCTDVLACKSTFRIPSEWRHVQEAAKAARLDIPRDSLVAGHSAVLFYADRRGFPMAYKPHEVKYLFGTWGQQRDESDPIALLDFYRDQGAEYFVELLGTVRERDNLDLFDYVRKQYRVVAESPGKYLVVSLQNGDQAR